MNNRNLIPLGRRRRRAFRHAAVRWAAAVPALVVTLGSIQLALSAGLPTATADAAEADRAAARALSARVVASGLRVQVAVARQALEAARAVSDQPDWSLLLADLSHRLGDDGILSGCGLTPGDGGTGKATAMTLRLVGVARSQPAATRLALRLEAAGIFDRVDLLRTTPAQGMGGEAVGFEMVCTLGTAGRVP